MTALWKRSGGGALAYLVATQGAWADLTAQDVWTDWKSYLSSAGYQITATENSSGGALNVTDLTLSINIADIAEGEDGTISVTIPEVSLMEKGDGTVSVSMPPEMVMMVAGEVEGDTFEVGVNYNQTGMSMIVSGSPQDMMYNYSAVANEISLASVKVDGEMAPPGLVDVALTMNNVTTSANMKMSDVRTMTQDMRAGSLTYNIAFNDPGSDDGGTMTGEISDLGFNGSGTIPAQMDPNDVRAMLDAGFAFDGTFSYGGGKTNVQAAGDGENIRVASSSTGGTFRVGMNAQNLIYDLSQTGVNVEVESGELPFPVAFAMAQAGFKIMMPTAQSETEQDVAMSLTLGDFTMSDMIWMIFDGGNVLPRDPASIIVDLSGKAKMLFDIFDTEAAMQMGMSGEQPAELNQLSINQLLVSAAGAKLTGEGAFTFDNTDLASFDGLPRPEGTLNLSLSGGNGLLDRLIQMGFVSENDAMGARMMMGMVAVPGDGPDTLNSKIEVNAQGHVLANGQRLK